MNRNKKTKSKKVNDAINNMGNSTSFESLNDVANNMRKDKKNIPEGLK
ncbi:MAG: hypothetical protein ACI8WT_002629 [Clostridium sp.]|jgi:hypothetical protein